MKPSLEKTMVKLVKLLIISVGEKPSRLGLRETPARVARMYKEILSGYSQNPKDVMKTFDYMETKNNDLVVVKKIPFYSLCEHHILPFFGEIHIGYVPKNKILGLSKFGRVVDILASRLQVQENLTIQVAELIMKYLKPKGVIVYSKAQHMCMAMRGVKKIGSITTVIIKRGIFEKNHHLTEQFLNNVEEN